MLSASRNKNFNVAKNEIWNNHNFLLRKCQNHFVNPQSNQRMQSLPNKDATLNQVTIGK